MALAINIKTTASKMISSWNGNLENEDFVARINDGRWDYCEGLISGTFRGHRG